MHICLQQTALHLEVSAARRNFPLIHVSHEAQCATAPPHALLFGEDQGCYLIAVPVAQADAIITALQGDDVPVQRLGIIGGADLVVEGTLAVPVKTLRAAHESWFPAYMGEA